MVAQKKHQNKIDLLKNKIVGSYVPTLTTYICLLHSYTMSYLLIYGPKSGLISIQLNTLISNSIRKAKKK